MTQALRSYKNMEYSEFVKIANDLQFEEVMSTNYRQNNDLKCVLFVNKVHSMILYAIKAGDYLSRATLYAEVKFDKILTKSQQQVLCGSGYVQVADNKVFFGFCVTKKLKQVVEGIIKEFEIVPKWTFSNKVCIGFIDNTYENGCGRAVGFTKQELKQNEQIASIMF